MGHFYTRRASLPLGARTYLVGILNLTPDSFSDGGEFFDQTAAEAHLFRLVDEGADIIDIGGESTRPGHTPVPVEEEIARVVPFLQSIRPKTDVLISIDTSKAAVAAAALDAGADMVNDVWGAQRDPMMAEEIGRRGAACILMHNRPMEKAEQGDVIEAIVKYLTHSIELVRKAGVREDAIILDPGLGFGKTYDENWAIMRRLPELLDLGYPILVGASRKSMIARLIDVEEPKARLYGTLGATAVAVDSGVDFIRVHDVRENRECVAVIDYCLRSDFSSL